MVPSKSELLNLNLSEIAIKFDVTERTARSWLKQYNIYHPRPNYGPNKLNKKKALEIRKLYLSGWTQQKLAKKFNVNQSMICRIVNNVAYHQKIHFSGGADTKVKLKW